MNPTTIRIMVDQRDGSKKEIGSIQINDGKVTNTAREDVIIKDPTGREAITTLLLKWIMAVNTYADNHNEETKDPE